MPTELTCTCGAPLKVPEVFAGRRVRCPGCQTILNVPTADVQQEDEAAAHLLADGPQTRSPRRDSENQSDAAYKPDAPARGRRPQDYHDEGDDRYSTGRTEARYPEPRNRDDDEPGRGRRRYRDDDLDDLAIRRIRSRDDSPDRVASRGGAGGGWGGINGGVGGGIASMAIAVVWFFGGLCFDTFFIYPPILFVIGLVAVIKGLASNK
jgi:hypothetical protein